MSVARGFGVLGLLVACTGGGSSALEDAAIDATDPDAALIDAPPDAAPPDVPRIDATPLCSIRPPFPITAPHSETPYEVTMAPLVAATFSFTTPVPLASLWFSTSTETVAASVLAGCGGPVVATGTVHSQMLGEFPERWTDGGAVGLAAGPYIVELVTIVGYNIARLDLHGVIVDGAACDDPLVAAGVLSCSAGANCVAGVCATAACSNGVDDDGDGLADDADPGCATVGDVDEQDTCGSGGPCPACADALDNDVDGAIDSADRGCERRGDSDERNCPDAEGLLQVTSRGPYALPATQLDQAGPANCRHVIPDRVLHLRVPGDLSALTIGVGQQPIDLALYRDACHTAPQVCALGMPGSPSTQLGPIAAGDYWLVAAPYNAGSSVTVDGALVAGARCDPSTSAFACSGGQACAPAVGGGHRCQ